MTSLLYILYAGIASVGLSVLGIIFCFFTESFLVDSVRGLVVQGGMKPFAIVEVYIALDASAELRQRFILLDSEVLVLQSPPEPFHPGVVPASAPTVHADLDAIRLEFIRELLAGKLAALIRIEDFRDNNGIKL